MSDGITDVHRDEEIIEKIKKIRSLEKEFENSSDNKLAEEIIEKLNELKDTRRGYFNAPNIIEIEKSIKKYQNYI